MEVYTRNCPTCGKEKTYANEWSYRRAKQLDTKCIHCAKLLEQSVSDKIVELHKSGIKVEDIASALSISAHPIYLRLRKLGLLRKQGKRVKVRGGYLCSECKTPKPKKKFSGNSSMCNSCKFQRTRNLVNSDVKRYLGLAVDRARTRSKNPISITKEYLAELFETQKGLCFYTDLPMRTIRGEGSSSMALSVDKIIPEKGYVVGNIVLATVKANVVKNNLTLEELHKWIPSWYDRIQARLCSN